MVPSKPGQEALMITYLEGQEDLVSRLATLIIHIEP